MTDLKKMPTYMLEAELQRRKDAALQRPEPVPTPDWSVVHQAIVGAVLELDEEGFVDEDLDHAVFEAALEAVYGPDVWHWWNAKRQ